MHQRCDNRTGCPGRRGRRRRGCLPGRVSWGRRQGLHSAADPDRGSTQRSFGAGQGRRLELDGILHPAGEVSPPGAGQRNSGGDPGIDDVYRFHLRLDAQRNAGGDVRTDVRRKRPLGSLCGHDQVDAQRPSDRCDSHQFLQGFGGVFDEHSKFVDDEDQMRKRAGWGAPGPVARQVRGLRGGKQFLPVPDFRAQGSQRAFQLVPGEVCEHAHAVGEARQRT
ncbi:hypothetical protein D9M72_461580 [compost metagenome]